MIRLFCQWHEVLANIALFGPFTPLLSVSQKTRFQVVQTVDLFILLACVTFVLLSI